MAESSSYRYSITKLNSENYPVWSYKMELMLIEENLWEVIVGSKPDATQMSEMAMWTKKDDKARARIGLSVEDDQLLHIRKATSARQAWESLKEYHQKATLTSKVLLLKRLCRMILHEDGDMEAHINVFSNNLNKLSALGLDLSDTLVAALLLGSLPESYDTLVIALESRPESDITFQFIKGKLIDEYKRRRGAQHIRENFAGNEAVMKTVHNEEKSKTSSKRCFFCNKIGHLKNDCRKFTAWKDKRKKEEIADKAIYLSDESEYCHIINENEENCNVQIGIQGKKRIFDKWIVDSGATSHMTPCRNFFQNFDSSRKGHVRLADNKKLAPIKGIGSGTIKCTAANGKTISMKVYDVLFVPSIDSSLLSVKKLTKEGYKLIFESEECKIIKDDELQAVALLSPELYRINMAEKVCAAHGVIKPIHPDNCEHVWHRRFGHRDPNAIKDLANNGLVTGMKIGVCKVKETCECCIKGKMARLPFPKESGTKTKAILDLIHTDVCGPLQTITPGQRRYILTIIDDYSRYSHVYLLRHKSEAASCIKEFISMTMTQFDKKPKIIRSDRGKEYVNQELQTYLKLQGIRMQYTAAYSPQQNGVAERKNRSLLEMSRCMLLDANIDKKYWGEAVHTANYLQNILPTRAIKKTPYEQWHSRKPNVNNLHIFGCDAYALVHKEQRRKLDLKANKFIFVGYSDESKAFRLLDSKTNKIKITRDVIFLDKFQKQKISENFDTKEELKNNDIEVDFCRNQDYTEDSDAFEDAEGNHEGDIIQFQVEKEVEEPRRSSRENRGVPPSRYTASVNLAIDEDNEPRNTKEALAGSDKLHWKKSMDEEMDSLMRNGTSFHTRYKGTRHYRL